MTRIDVHDVMARLAERRPIFHSEADFKFALAWTIKNALPDCEVRLEYKPFPAEPKPIYLDMWLQTEGAAIELKHLTRSARADYAGEQFTLRSQSAGNFRRYDYVEDVQRLERVVDECESARIGFAILLTNDPLYWEPTARETNDAAFRLHEGNTLTGEMAWENRSRVRQVKSAERDAPLLLKNAYALHWRDYSDLPVEHGKFGKFRYLVVEVAQKRLT